jgi:predicted dehydrogenase
MIRIGVVGAGWFASRRHLPELAAHPEVELAALCRRSPEPLARLAAHFGVPRTFTDCDAMLAGADLDAVLICSPHNLHHPQACAAIAAGCHVLLEKPMCLTGAEARDLAARAEAAGRVLEVAYNPPYWRHSQWLRERVADGGFGAIEGVDLRTSGNLLGLFGQQPLDAKMPGVVPPTTFRGDLAANGGGQLMDSGAHPVCEVCWVTGQRIVSLDCVMDAVPADRRAGLSFTLAGGGWGAIGSIGDSSRAGKLSLGLWQGSAAVALVRAAPFEILWLPEGGAPRTITEAEMPAVPSPVASFVDAIAGRAEPRCPGRQAVAYVEVIEAAYRAAATGQRQVL